MKTNLLLSFRRRDFKRILKSCKTRSEKVVSICKQQRNKNKLLVIRKLFKLEEFYVKMVLYEDKNHNILITLSQSKNRLTLVVIVLD